MTYFVNHVPLIYLTGSDVLSLRRRRFKNDTLYVLSSGSLIKFTHPAIFLRLILCSVCTITVSSSFLLKIMSYLCKIYQLRSAIIKRYPSHFTNGLALASRRIVRLVCVIFRAGTDHFQDYFTLFNSGCIWPKLSPVFIKVGSLPGPGCINIRFRIRVDSLFLQLV